MTTYTYHQPINVAISASGDNTVIPAVAGQVIKVHAVTLGLDAPVTVTIKDGNGNVMTSFPAGVLAVGVGVPGREEIVFVCAPGTSLVVNLGGAAGCKGTVWYSQVMG